MATIIATTAVMAKTTVFDINVEFDVSDFCSF